MNAPRTIVRTGVYRSGQPTADDLAEFRRIGGRAVLRLSDDGDITPDQERLIAQNFGLLFSYIQLPGWRAPNHTIMGTLLDLIDDADEQPILVHCLHGVDRTGTVVACDRISHDSWTAEAAIMEANALHMSWISFPMRWFIRRWRP